MSDGSKAAAVVGADVAKAGDRFPDALQFTWRRNNDGQALHTTPGDRGGATAWGVTLLSYASWRADHGIHGTTAADLGRATKDELGELIRARYWSPVAAPALPRGIDLLVYDFGFGSGPGTSARVLQRELGVDADGVIGPHTCAAAAARGTAALAHDLAARHDGYYRSLDDYALFGRGWSRRNNDRLALALALIGS